MRYATPLLALPLLLAACGQHNSQADALDNAARQSDPTAAAELHNQADAIRENQADASLSDPNASAQHALQSAGNATANSDAAAAPPH